MTPDDLRARINTLTVWKQGGRRAPHKPLLVLYALARFADGQSRLDYQSVEKPLLDLLRDFGPPTKKVQAYSFWRLQSDGIWSVDEGKVLTFTSAGDPTVTSLRAQNPDGHFTPEVAEVLRAHPGLTAELVQLLLDAHFPASMHEDILTAIGYDPDGLALALPRQRRRDPRFRDAVLRAYGYRCGVCGFETRVGHALVGVDAAHVRWHNAGGADDVTNGIALCALHHRLLDRGAFTLVATSSSERVVQVAEEAHGGEGFERWLLAFHDRPILRPVNTTYQIAEPAMAWHRREVFRSPSRS